MRTPPKFKLIVLLIFITLVIFIAYQGYNIKRHIFLPITQALSSDINSGSQLQIKNYFDQDKSFNILLLGYGGGTHDGAYLTDSMILVNINPASKIITLISIPRDIWVKIPTNGNEGSYWKINAAYTIGMDDQDYPNKKDIFKGDTGASNMVKFVINSVTGISVDRFVALDFSGFKKTIDALGGVDVTVAKTFDDYEYPIDGKEDDLCGHSPSELPDLEKIATISATQAFPCRYEHLHFDAGMTHMDGELALEFVRSRHSLQDGTDFGRSTRQRDLLIAVKQKVFSISFIPRIISFMNSLKDDLKTDIQPDEISYLVNQASTLNSYSIHNIALTDQNVLKDNITSDGQDILIPKSGLDNWGDVKTWSANSLTSNNFSPTIEVENGTSIPGLATLASNRLSDKDYNLLPPSNSDQKLQKTQIIIFNKQLNLQLINDIKSEFNVNKISYQEDKTDYDILIIVGQDYNNIQGKKLIN